MRLLPLFLLIFLSFFLDVNAQRRTSTAKPDSTSATQRISSRGRGRSRFATSADQVHPQTSPRAHTEPISRRTASRKRVINSTEGRIPPRVVGTLIKTENFARVSSEVPRPEIPSRVSTSAIVPNFVPRAELAEKRTLKHEVMDRRSFSVVGTERRPSSRNSYEVLEVLDDLPEFQPSRRAKKTRDFESKNPSRRNPLQKLPTESTEASKSTVKSNFPRRNPLQNLPTESPEAFKSSAESNSSRNLLLQNLPTEYLEASSEASHSPAEETNIVEDTDDTTLNALPLEVSSELSVPEESLTDTKTQPLGDSTRISAPVRSQNGRRNGARRNPVTIDQTTQASRSRTRTRVTKVPDAAEPVRSSRRRVGPSVFTAEGSQKESPRARSSRTIESSQEKISTDSPSTRHGRRNNTPSSASQKTGATSDRTSSRTIESPPEKIHIDLASTRRSRRNSTPSSSPQKTRETSDRTSSRTIESAPEKIHIDLASTRRSRRNSTFSSAQQKIGEAATRKSITRSSESRIRSREVPPLLDETKLEVLPLFETEPRLVNSVGTGNAQGSERRRIMSDNSTETKKGAPSRMRESVVSEVSQVISRGTVPRRKGLGVNIKAFDPLARGSKRAEPKQPENGSSEEVDDSDNYPEPFKALIKAMKGKKESSAGKIAESRHGLTNFVTSSSSVSSRVSTTTGISETAKEINGLDNEIFPKQPSINTPSPRTRSPRPIDKPSFEKFNPPTRRRANGGVAFKPKESGADRRARGNSGQVRKQQEPELVAAVEKPGRRKYNSDLASRSTLPRFTTNAPRYIPTIPSMPYVPTVPTITLPRTSVYLDASKKDPDLGVEVISFDDPVPPLPSENLVKDASASFTENQLSLALPLVSDGTTEKPVSIFERIINSLTAISTPSPMNSTASNATESTSAILKLARAKPDTVTLTHTTDKSTTIIERILSSINAIQATDDSRAPQVRTDFNTLSFTTTTPALYSTSSIDPLSVLDDITPEQALQKRTIGKLLEILNGMISTTMQPPVVVVTPKSFNSATAVNTDSSTDPLLTSTEMPSTTILTSTDIPSTTLLTSTESISTTLIPSTEITSTTLIPSTDDSTTVTEPFSDMELLATSTITTMTESKSSTMTENSPVSSTESTSFPSTSEVGLTHTVDPYTLAPLFSTLPTLDKFEVSPGSVSVFSANDLFNSVTPDDDLSTTISIQSRSNTATTLAPSTTESPVDTTQEVATTTLNNPTTTLGVNRSVVTNRSGRLLNVLQNPVQNSIDFSSTTSTTPAYYVFAVLNNNTILRKDPPRVASDEKAPYLVVGVYPDNTVVRRYPNGTVVPRERVIRVRGFDTRVNPPPLPEITSNQVTFDRGVSEKEDGRHFQTAEQNSLPSIEASPLSGGRTVTTAATNLSSTSTPERSPRTNNKPFTVPPRSGAAPSVAVAPRVDGTAPVSGDSADTNATLSTLSELFDGKTLDALNEIVNSVQTNTDITLQGIKYNNVLNIQDLLKSRTSGQPIMSTTPTIFTKVDSTTLQPESSTVGTTVAPSTTTETVFTTTTLKVTTEIQATISNEISEGKSTTGAPVTSFTTISTTTTPAPTTASSTTTTAPTSTTTTVPTTTTTKEVTSSTARIPFTTKSIRLTTTPTKVPSRLPEAAPTASLFPTFFTTLFPNLFTAEVATRTPRVLTTNSPGVIRISAAPSVTENLLVAASTTRASTVAAPSTITTDTPGTTIAATTTTPIPTTTTTTLRTTVTTTTPMTTTTTRSPTTQRNTTPRTSTTEKNVPVTDLNTVTEVTTKKKLKELTAEQKENLRTLMQLEKDQAALLQQLSFLTNLNLGGRTANQKKITTQKSSSKDLAERVVALAVERDKNAKTTTRKPPASIQDQLAAIDATRQPKKVTPSIEEVLKQYNLGELDVTATPTSSYGKSDDAILASILKQQGISPPTPKSLADQIKQAGLFDGSTTRKPKPKQKPRPRPTTTPPPGRLMQGLNWLLNALAPPPPSPPRPAKRPAKPKRPPTDQQELFATSPTHVTPVVTTAPRKQGTAIGANSLTQQDIQKLIAQLEGLQGDTSGKTLDLSQVKSLQNLINIDEGVVVLANGEHGATSRRTTTSRPTSSGTTTAKRPTSVRTTRKRHERKLTTVAPSDTVSNFVGEDELEDEFEVTTKKHRAPIGFRPVPGLDDDSSDSLVRSNLITAAVNVTKAISGFLGTALQTVSQGAAQSFQSLWGAGSSLGTRVLGGAASGSSAGPG